MDDFNGGIKFVNNIGSDIDLWTKGPYDQKYNYESCLMYDEPEYYKAEVDEDTSWKFFDHITKRYLLGNGEKIFHYPHYESPPTIVQIYTPLYTLQELCISTISTRLFANNVNETDLDELELPKVLKDKVNSHTDELKQLYEADVDVFDWTAEYGYAYVY